MKVDTETAVTDQFGNAFSGSVTVKFVSPDEPADVLVKSTASARDQLGFRVDYMSCAGDDVSPSGPAEYEGRQVVFIIEALAATAEDRALLDGAQSAGYLEVLLSEPDPSHPEVQLDCAPGSVNEDLIRQLIGSDRDYRYVQPTSPVTTTTATPTTTS